MIDRRTIDRILAAADIVEVVREFVTLRKNGQNYKGLCPFHDDKTPSFVVSPAKQICKCFSCGTGGDVIGFLMKHEQLTYSEAIKWLGKKYGIEVEEREQTDEERAAQTKRESMFVLNEWARDYFANMLHNDRDGQAIGMAYFRDRGFRDDIIRKFQLGYSPELRDALAKEATAKGFSKEQLTDTGLCFETSDGRLLDRYHGRVIFPVHTVSGRVVAFGGRILGAKQKNVGKYVNSPESDIYNKSRELYGLYLAKAAIAKQNRCFLVEGYTDVIQMHQSGIENVVASSGTSLTEGQIRLLHRFTRNITVLYDGDAAGIKASLRGIDMLLAAGMNVKVLLLPDGEDPDSFARARTAEELRQFIEENQTDFIKFKTRLLFDETTNDPVQRAEAIKDIVKSISVIPDGLLRGSYAKECALQMQMQEATILHEITLMRSQGDGNRAVPAEPSEQNQPEQAPAVQEDSGKRHASELLRQEEQIALMIIRHGHRVLASDPPVAVAAYVQDNLAKDGLSLQHPTYSKLLLEAARQSAEPGFDAPRYFRHHPDAAISQLAAKADTDLLLLSKSQLEGYIPEEERLPMVVQQQLNTYKYEVLREREHTLRSQLRQPEVAADLKRSLQIMGELKQLNAVTRRFAEVLDRVVIPR